MTVRTRHPERRVALQHAPGYISPGILRVVDEGLCEMQMHDKEWNMKAARDPRLFPHYSLTAHCERVGNLGKYIAERVGLHRYDVDLIWVGGTLHDIGKTNPSDFDEDTGLPMYRQDIDYNDKQRQHKNRHEVFSAQFLERHFHLVRASESEDEFLRRAHIIVANHSSCNELENEQLRRDTFIVEAADVFDAMTEVRGTIRAPYSAEEAVKLLEVWRSTEGARVDVFENVMAALRQYVRENNLR